jgi:hypothetical protein
MVVKFNRYFKLHWSGQNQGAVGSLLPRANRCAYHATILGAGTECDTMYISLKRAQSFITDYGQM